MIKEFNIRNAKIQVFDPEAMENVKKTVNHNNVKFCNTAYDALDGADFLVIATEWHQFRTPDFKKVKRLLKTLLFLMEGIFLMLIRCKIMDLNIIV